MEKHKVVLLGDESAGKTSLVRRFMYDTFEDSVQSTIGMDFQSKTVYLEDRSVKLQLWDTAGQERFRSLIPSYLRGAAAAVVVYDMTRRASFEGARNWINEIRNERGEEALVALVGNKSDLEGREVSAEEGQNAAQELDVTFSETSAKLGHNVKAVFEQLAKALPQPPPVADVAAPMQDDVLQIRAENGTPGDSGTKKKCQ
eukprot:CAMPEP_0172808490 /NCGR_PEP_ID=MMETSP1075-20121228/7722_1 /TAXON_ID=2916 /ORGANISM="Ceratium fusus, Strain PA161109" /LENGTH=200 /DNA_ID=CAMNT_0013647653 /DNA_START=70 /DNA_END=669 /DNA_ORIENTATION=-